MKMYLKVSSAKLAGIFPRGDELIEKYPSTLPVIARVTSITVARLYDCPQNARERRNIEDYGSIIS